MDSILVINCGSSSLKFAVLAYAGQDALVEGIVDKLGSDTCTCNTHVWIIPTNEELMIALDTINLIQH